MTEPTDLKLPESVINALTNQELNYIHRLLFFYPNEIFNIQQLASSNAMNDKLRDVLFEQYISACKPHMDNAVCDPEVVIDEINAILREYPYADMLAFAVRLTSLAAPHGMALNFERVEAANAIELTRDIYTSPAPPAISDYPKYTQDLLWIKQFIQNKVDEYKQHHHDARCPPPDSHFTDNWMSTDNGIVMYDIDCYQIRSSVTDAIILTSQYLGVLKKTGAYIANEFQSELLWVAITMSGQKLDITTKLVNAPDYLLSDKIATGLLDIPGRDTYEAIISPREYTQSM